MSPLAAVKGLVAEIVAGALQEITARRLASGTNSQNFSKNLRISRQVSSMEIVYRKYRLF